MPGLVIYGLGYYGIWGFWSGVAIPMIVVGAVWFIIALTTILIKNNIDLRNKYNVFFKTNKGKVCLNSNTGEVKHRKSEFKIEEGTSYQLVKNEKVLLSSGIGEAIVDGVLFGGAGAMAGAYIGKKEKNIKECVLYIETNNIIHAGITIPVTEEAGFKICKVFDLYNKKEKK